MLFEVLCWFFWIEIDYWIIFLELKNKLIFIVIYEEVFFMIYDFCRDSDVLKFYLGFFE